MLESAFSRRRLRYAVQDWTATSKPEAVARLRRVLAEGSIQFAPHDGMRQLAALEERVTPSGAFTYAGRGSTHDDYVALTLTTLLADLAGDLERSPIRKEVPRGMRQQPIVPF